MNKETETEKVLSEHTGGPNTTFGARLRGYFLAGILVSAPISITIYLTYIFLIFIDDFVKWMMPQHWIDSFAITIHDFTIEAIPGIGLLSALVFFIIVGWFTTNFLGRLFLRLAEYILDRMPVIRTVYGSLKQIFQTIMASRSQAFREVVMLEYPRKGVWSIGFVTGRTKGEVQKAVKNETINVFVPTTPNPTSGFLLFVPKKDLIYLDMNVEDGIKLVISGGIITPPHENAAKSKVKTKPKKVAAKSKTKTAKAAPKKRGRPPKKK